jgi:plasmid maintenance system killer protein
MKATLEFDLDSVDDKENFELTQKALNMQRAIDKALDILRDIRKYQDLQSPVAEFFEALDDELLEALDYDN